MYNCDPLKEKERQYFPEGECVCVCNLVWSDRINAYMYIYAGNERELKHCVTTYMHTYICIQYVVIAKIYLWLIL